MRILITGGAGCLGSNLVERFLPRGHDVLVVDNFATSRPELVRSIPGLRVVEGTIADPAVVDRCFDEFKPTHVIHSAAAYKDPSDWREDTASNVQGTINVVAASRRHVVRRFLNFQTALCYGRPMILPIPIEHPLAPFTSYGISKSAGESYALLSDLPVVSMRLANVTGPRLSIGPIPTFYRRLKAGQKCFCSETVRDFIDMSDFFAIVDLALADGAPTGAFNVSTGEGVTIKRIFDAVADHLGVALSEPVPIVPPGADDVPTVVLDPKATIAAFGWRAKKTFEDTIAGMLAWYDAHGISDIYSHLAPPRAG